MESLQIKTKFLMILLKSLVFNDHFFRHYDFILFHFRHAILKKILFKELQGLFAIIAGPEFEPKNSYIQLYHVYRNRIKQFFFQSIVVLCYLGLMMHRSFPQYTKISAIYSQSRQQIGF